MRIVHLLLLSLAPVTSCAGRGPDLLQPVGQSIARRPPPHAEVMREVLPEYVPSDSQVDDERSCSRKKLPVIEFSSASVELSTPQKSELQSLASCLTDESDAPSVVLVGYADIVGSVAANLELGLRRAQVVMGELIDDGVSPGRIVVSSAGELQRPHARWGLHAARVEILLARGGPERPDEAPIVRGIDAEGLPLRRPPPVAPSGRTTLDAPPRRRSAMPTRSATPRGAPAAAPSR